MTDTLRNYYDASYPPSVYDAPAPSPPPTFTLTSMTPTTTAVGTNPTLVFTGTGFPTTGLVLGYDLPGEGADGTVDASGGLVRNSATQATLTGGGTEEVDFTAEEGDVVFVLSDGVTETDPVTLTVTA